MAMVRYVVAKSVDGWRRFDCADDDASETYVANNLQCKMPRFRVEVKSQANLLVERLNRLEKQVSALNTERDQARRNAVNLWDDAPYGMYHLKDRIEAYRKALTAQPKPAQPPEGANHS